MLGLTVPERAVSPLPSALCAGSKAHRGADGEAASASTHAIEHAPGTPGVSERAAWERRLDAVSDALDGALAVGRQHGWDLTGPAETPDDPAVPTATRTSRSTQAKGRRVRHTRRYALLQRSRARRARRFKRGITVTTVANVLRQLSQCSAPFTHGSQLALDLYAAASGDEVSGDVRTVLKKCGAVIDQLSGLIPQVFYLQTVCNGFRIAADTLDGKPLLPEDGIAMITLLSQIITMRSRLPTSYLTPSTGRFAARLAGAQIAAASGRVGARTGLRLMGGGRSSGIRYRVPSRSTRPMRHRSDSEVAVVYPGKGISGEPSQRSGWGARDEVRTSVSFSRPETNKYQELGSRAGLSDFTSATREVHAWIGMYRETMHQEVSTMSPPADVPATSTVDSDGDLSTPTGRSQTDAGHTVVLPDMTAAASTVASTTSRTASPTTSFTASSTPTPTTSSISAAASGSTVPAAVLPLTDASASNATRAGDTQQAFTVPPWLPSALISAEGVAVLDALEEQSDRRDFQIAYVNQVPVRTRWPNEAQWEAIPLLEYRVPGVSVRGREQGERFLSGRSDYVSLGPFAVGVREILPGKLWMIDRRVHHGTRLPHYPLVRDGASWRPRRATTTPALEANGPSSASDGFVRYLNRKFIDFSNVRVDVPRTVIDDEEPIADLAQRVERMLPGAHKTQVIYTDEGHYLIEGEYGYYTLGYHDETQSFYVTGEQASRAKREVPVFFDTRLRRWVVTHNPHYPEDEHDGSERHTGADTEREGNAEETSRDALDAIAEVDEVDEGRDATRTPDVDRASDVTTRLPERATVSGAFDSGRLASTWANASLPLAGHPSEPHNVRAAHAARLADKVWAAEWSAILAHMQRLHFFSSPEGRGDIRTRLYIALANTFASMHYDLPTLTRAVMNVSETAGSSRDNDNVATESQDDMTMRWRRQIAPFYPPPDRWAHMSLQQRQRQVGLLLRLAYPEEGSLRPLSGERDCGVATHAFHAGLVDADAALRDHYLELVLVDRRGGRRHPMLLYVDDPLALRTFTRGRENATRVVEDPPHLSPIELCHFLVARTGTMLLIDVARPSRIWEFDQVDTVETAAQRFVSVLERRGFGEGLDHDFSAVAEVPAYASAQASYQSAAARSRRLLFQALRRRGGDNCYAGLCVTRNVAAAVQNVSSVTARPEAVLARFGQGAALPQGVSIETIARDVEALPDEANLPPACVPLFGALASALPHAHTPALRAALSRLTLGALFHVDQARRANDEDAASRMVVACGVIGEALNRLLLDEKA